MPDRSASDADGRRRSGPPPPDPYPAALALLAARDLSTAQLRDRLIRKGCDPAAIDAAVARLQRERALDDRRTAALYARRAAHAVHRGPHRAVREIAALGIAAPIARAAVAEAYGELDLPALIARALARRLPDDAVIRDRAHFARLYRALLRQGFDAPAVLAVLRRRAAAGAAPDDDPAA